MNKFKSWATLNDEGRKEWSDVFPEGEVPIVSIVGIWMQADPKAQPELAYLIRREEMTTEQQLTLLAKLSEKFKAPKEAILEEWNKNGLPIRAKFTSSAGTNNIGMFLPDNLDDEGDYDAADSYEDYDDYETNYDDTGGYP